jgi:hypothetical protein
LQPCAGGLYRCPSVVTPDNCISWHCRLYRHAACNVCPSASLCCLLQGQSTQPPCQALSA